MFPTIRSLFVPLHTSIKNPPRKLTAGWHPKVPFWCWTEPFDPRQLSAGLYGSAMGLCDGFLYISSHLSRRFGGLNAEARLRRWSDNDECSTGTLSPAGLSVATPRNAIPSERRCWTSSGGLWMESVNFGSRRYGAGRFRLAICRTGHPCVAYVHCAGQPGRMLSLRSFPGNGPSSTRGKPCTGGRE
jgi:hypothetical protein